MAEEEKWEYFCTFVKAHIDNEWAKEYVKEQLPNWLNTPKFSPVTMNPYLNSLGNDGWELVHMQPVGLWGDEGQVQITGSGGVDTWTNSYFCVFKRKRGM